MTDDLNGYLLNCFVGGETGDTQPDGTLIENRIELSFGGREVTILQRPEILAAKPGEYRGQAVPTTTVVVHEVRAEERDDVRNLLEGLSYLLSLATCSQVALYGLEHPGDPPLRERWAVVAYAGYFRAPFDIHDGNAMRTYLELVWRRYFELEEIRKLRVAIDLFVLADTRSLPLELRLATMFILLENLKSTFAEEQGYPFERNRYRDSSGSPWSFKALLATMFEKVGMTSPDLGAIVDLRNEIVHSGVSQTPHDHQEEMYEKCQDLVREYFLRLLGYRGSFRLYSGRGMTPKNI